MGILLERGYHTREIQSYLMGRVVLERDGLLERGKCIRERVFLEREGLLIKRELY